MESVGEIIWTEVHSEQGAAVQCSLWRSTASETGQQTSLIHIL